MPVNSGSDGTEISFSDLQAAYGDPTPTPGDTSIPLSAFYRGSSVVPNTRTTTDLAAGSDSGSGDNNNAAGIRVDVQNSSTTSTSTGSLRVSSFTGTGVVNTADLSYVYARSEGRGNHTVVLYPGPNGSGHPTQIFSYSQDDNPGFTIAYRGTTYQSGDGSPTVRSNATRYTGNRSLGFSGFRTPAQIGRRTQTTTTTQRRTFVFTNTTGQTIDLTTTSMGGNSNTTRLNNNQSVTRGPFNGSNEAWTVSYPAVTSTSSDANDEIPTTGNPIDLDGFNTPGNFTP